MIFPSTFLPVAVPFSGWRVSSGRVRSRARNGVSMTGRGDGRDRNRLRHADNCGTGRRRDRRSGVGQRSGCWGRRWRRVWTVHRIGRVEGWK